MIDDDEAGRESLEAWLVANGLRALTFASANDFLARADLSCLGCVITDFRMPGLSGTDLQLEISQRNSPLPVIVISGYADVQVAVRAMRQGAVTLLEKPFDSAELLHAIEEALRQSWAAHQQLQTASEIRERLATLSELQREIMDLLVAGQPNKSVAKRLDLGLRTVERHRQQIFQKMQVNSLPELATLLASHRGSKS